MDDRDAGWIGANRRPFFDHTIGSLVPVVFERYARVLHPAWAEPDAPVRWETVARWSGRTMHATAQWKSLSKPLGQANAACPFVGPPATGGLPPRELRTLCDLLAAHTGSPDRCFVGVWEGYRWLDWADVSSTSELHLDQRAFLVSAGPIEDTSRIGWRHEANAPTTGGIATLHRHDPERPAPGVAQGGSSATGVGTFVPEPPTLIWPVHRAWFVASDVDLDSTYVGGSGKLIAVILRERGLEAWPADPTDRFTVDSDAVNVV
jgi:hypothetical protein